MDRLVELKEKPSSKELYMIAGWRQWADAGSVSSGLPEYLVDMTGAHKIGEIRPDPFFLFQLPGTQHFLRPEIKLSDGHVEELRPSKTEIYYTQRENAGLLIFLGDEPHLNIERYAELFFEMAQELKIKRIVALGGVYAAVPYRKDRDVSCTYSLKRMKKELANYAVRFSNYEGGASIGSYLASRAGQLNIEYLVMHAMVPMYDLSELSPNLEAMMIEQDWKAWYDVMQRLNHMLKLQVDLSDMLEHSQELLDSMAKQIDELEIKVPQAGIRAFIAKVEEGFSENSFMPLDDVWERGLGDVLDGMDR